MLNHDLFASEILEAGLPKATNHILNLLDLLIDHYQQNGADVDRIPLYPDQYQRLQEALARNNQDIQQSVYRGYTLYNIERPGRT